MAYAPLIVALSKAVLSRAEAQGIKGKRRDDIALNMFCGAWAAFEAQGMANEANLVGRVAAMLIATRGARECERIVRGE
jgi:hypothetical protein